MSLHNIHLEHWHHHMGVENLVKEDEPACTSSLLEGSNFSVLRM